MIFFKVWLTVLFQYCVKINEVPLNFKKPVYYTFINIIFNNWWYFVLFL